MTADEVGALVDLEIACGRADIFTFATQCLIHQKFDFSQERMPLRTLIEFLLDLPNDVSRSIRSSIRYLVFADTKKGGYDCRRHTMPTSVLKNHLDTRGGI